MTGWLVASVGFGFKLEAFALPLIGIGMLARLLGSRSRLGATGEALAETSEAIPVPTHQGVE